jgi:NAD(P)-dependent dehydrogenase (short-subunit alcohol dehydrogenase family)
MLPVSLKDKVAVVTGGSRGIGEAVCAYLARADANVVVADVDLDGAVKVAERLRDDCSKTMSVKTDVSKLDDVRLLIENTLLEFGRLDIMVNNAGVDSGVGVENMSKEEWDRVMDINLWGAFLGCKYASEPMKRQKKGKIVNVSSLSAKTGGVFSGMNYSASKAGVWALTKSFAKLLAPYRINVNAICPGQVDTPMFRKLTDQQIVTLTRAIPLGRVGLPQDIAGAVLFLASDLSDFLTGVALDVNGGELMY